MSLPSQPLSSEDPEQQLTLPSSIEEETLTELPTTSDSLPENTEQQPIHTASEDMPTQPEAPSELDENLTSTPDENLTSTPDENLTSTPDENLTSTPDENLTSTPDENLTSTPDENLTSTSNEEEEDEEDEEDEEEEDQKGIFIQRGWLIAAACVVVIAALLVTLLLLVNRPQDPPTDWIASYTPPAGSSSATKILYYLHWTNQNSDLKGQLHLAANANGTPQSLTVPVVGLYNKENHIIYVVITINGQPDTLTGTVNDKNDVLILDQVNAPNQENQLVFHTGSANDYQQATKKLNSGTK